MFWRSYHYVFGKLSLCFRGTITIIRQEAPYERAGGYATSLHTLPGAPHSRSQHPKKRLLRPIKARSPLMTHDSRFIQRSYGRRSLGVVGPWHSRTLAKLDSQLKNTYVFGGKDVCSWTKRPVFFGKRTGVFLGNVTYSSLKCKGLITK